MRGMSTALLALLSVVGVALAQTDHPIARGARVRVTPSPPSRRVVGQLIAVSDSALVVRSRRGGNEIMILRSNVVRLEVSRGTNRAESALIGTLLGAVIGGVIGYASVSENSSFVEPLEPRDGAVIGGFYGVVTGSLMGVLVGSVERWRNVAVPMSLSVMPTSEGSMSIGGRIAF
jgi:hypothetical protein